MATQRKSFDHAGFARDSASGLYSRSALAIKYGLSGSMVKKLLAGQRRPEVREMIESARAEARLQVQTRAVELVEEAVGTLARAMRSASDAVALAAAKEVLNRAAGRSPWVPAEPERPPEPQEEDDDSFWRLWKALSPETRRMVMRDLGGPMEEEGQDPSCEPCEEPEAAEAWGAADAGEPGPGTGWPPWRPEAGADPRPRPPEPRPRRTNRRPRPWPQASASSLDQDGQQRCWPDAGEPDLGDDAEPSRWPDAGAPGRGGG